MDHDAHVIAWRVWKRQRRQIGLMAQTSCFDECKRRW
jgi:hypothetical protein